MHLQQEVSIRENKTAYGTVAVVDMVGYSTLARMLEENMGTGSVADLNRQIQDFVQSALRHLDDPSACTKIAETGDGVILLFEAAHDAHLFAEQLHRNAEKHNRSRDQASAKRCFRIGIATGEVNQEKVLLEKQKYAGITIANAVRLETAAEAGEIVIDIETFGILPKGDRVSYGPETMVRGKRDEVFIARRYKVVNSIHSQEPEVKPLFKTKLFKMTAAASAFAVAVVTILFEQSSYLDPMLHFFSSSAGIPVLRSIGAEPVVVQQGGILVITVGIDRPAPKNGIGVVLSSSDPSVLPISGQVPINQGEVFGTKEFQVPYTPNYRPPIHIVGSFNGETVSSSVSVSSVSMAGSPVPKLSQGAGAEKSSKGLHNLSGPGTVPTTSTTAPSTVGSSPKADPLNTELLSRLEEAQGRLSSEVGYWETMKKQMPPGTSLRPEITSQIYAAKSASQRCSDEVKVSDAASLGPCVDSLNDHLNQLKLQH